MEIAKQIEQTQDLTNSVRDHINTHRYQVDLLADSSTWNQICSSLDVIGDSLFATESFLKSEYPDDYGLKYIFTYGLLQALFLQQDALRHLSEAFGLKYELSENLLSIRHIRNASIGHPTKLNRKGKKYYYHISRISMGKHGFDLLQYSEPRDYKMLHINFQEVISDQLSAIISGYKSILAKLKRTEKEHMDKFINEPLQDIFHSGMGYFFEKIAQGIYAHSSGDREFGHRQVEVVQDTYKKFEEALRERNELTEYTEFDLSTYYHALDMIKKYLAGEDTYMEEVDARIFMTHVRVEHENFVQIAKEIDNSYQTTE